jgi:hypothetical protein
MRWLLNVADFSGKDLTRPVVHLAAMTTDVPMLNEGQEPTSVLER